MNANVFISTSIANTKFSYEIKSCQKVIKISSGKKLKVGQFINFASSQNFLTVIEAFKAPEGIILRKFRKIGKRSRKVLGHYVQILCLNRGDQYLTTGFDSKKYYKVGSYVHYDQEKKLFYPTDQVGSIDAVVIQGPYNSFPYLHLRIF